MEKRSTRNGRAPIAREVFELFLPLIIAGVILLALNSLIYKLISLWIVSILLIVLAGFMLLFYRDPKRIYEYSKGTVISPADGKIVGIAEIEENKYLKGKATRVSIFLRIYDVHMNYSPVDGIIEHRSYHKGKFGIAGFDKASDLNEHLFFGIKTEEERFALKLIAGMFARRIVVPFQEGSKIVAGERIGLIKFGSRADIFIPPGYDIAVKTGEKVRGALTVIARKK